MDIRVMASSLGLVGKEIGDARIGHSGPRPIPLPKEFLIFITENIEVYNKPLLDVDVERDHRAGG